MLDLEKIKERRAAIGEANWSFDESRHTSTAMLYLGENHTVHLGSFQRPGTAQFIAYAPADIDMLVAEVEKLWEQKNHLMAGLHAIVHNADASPGGGWWISDDNYNWLCDIARLVGLPLEQDEEPLQPCGHPRSAIVTNDDLGGPGTSYCSMCAEEGKKK